MINKNHVDLMESLRSIKKILDNRPNSQEMLKEVRMMRFKIKPIFGNVTEIDLNDFRLIETLWSLGKLEEFVDREYRHISYKDRMTFIRILTSIKDRLKDNLNKIDIKRTNPRSAASLIEMEILREIPRKKQVN